MKNIVSVNKTVKVEVQQQEPPKKISENMDEIMKRIRKDAIGHIEIIRPKKEALIKKMPEAISYSKSNKKETKDIPVKIELTDITANGVLDIKFN